MTWGKWQAKEIRYGLREADSNLMFAVTSNTRTRRHNLRADKQIQNKTTGKQWSAANQQKLAAKVTDALWRMWKIYMGIKDGLNKYLEKTYLDGYHTGRNHNQKISKLKIPWGWQHLREGSHIHTQRGQGVDPGHPAQLQQGQVLSDQASGLLQWASIGLDKGKAIVLYMDFCKAFDVVPTTSFSKLERGGFDEWTVRWIIKWLIGCIQRIVVNGSESQRTSRTSGVPQSLYCDSVIQYLQKSHR